MIIRIPHAFWLCPLLLFSCKETPRQPALTRGADTLAIKALVSSAPLLTPAQSIASMKVEQGFQVVEVASEPDVIAPVAMTFDDKGRIWVAEMQGYMEDTAGSTEAQRTGRIVILEDSNHDGRMDTRTVFLDSLLMPRALCLIGNGLLVAEPPMLWFVAINGIRAGKKLLVDSAYAAGGNPEHQPNALVRAMDNWVYSANGEKKYRKKGGRWISQPTFPRGQWGLSQDDYGRLFYNNNSFNLLGDYFSPSFGVDENVPGFNEEIVSDNSVFPARPTPGVNRGYLQGILDDSLRLRNFTAASGPVIYRGDLFGKSYAGNAFIGEPAGNLIKRDLLTDSGYRVSGSQAYHQREFLTSTDERFRPVTLYNGPDGALYILDMYRGIIQHKTYLTGYLKQEIAERKLSSPVNCGRIYKVVPIHYANATTVFPQRADSLEQLLHHPNGWIRDKAQQLLTDGNYTAAIPKLRRNLKNDAEPVAAVHSLWTLEGLDALHEEDLLPLLASPAWQVRSNALTICSSVLTQKNYRKIVRAAMPLIEQKDSLCAPLLGFLIKRVHRFNAAAADLLNKKINRAFPSDGFVQAAATYGKKTNAGIAVMTKKNLPLGWQLFSSVCQTCHGEHGNGLQSLAPPLNGSEWVNGDKNHLISIVLYGLTGPVKVHGRLYQAPEISGEMPGLANNKDVNDEQIAQVLSLIRQSWSNNAKPVHAEDVKKVREKNKERRTPFTAAELINH